MRDSPTGQGNPSRRSVLEQPCFLPPPHRVDKRLDRGRGLGTSLRLMLPEPREHHGVEMRLVPRIVPVSNPEPHDVLQGVVGYSNSGEPSPEKPRSLPVKTLKQPAFVPKEGVDGGGGRPGPSSEPPKTQGVHPTVKDEGSGIREQPPTKRLIVHLWPTHPTSVS